MAVPWIYIGTRWDSLRSEKAAVVVMPDEKFQVGEISYLESFAS